MDVYQKIRKEIELKSAVGVLSRINQIDLRGRKQMRAFIRIHHIWKEKERKGKKREQLRNG